MSLYVPVYTTYDDVVRLLGASKLQIRIGYNTSDHISEENTRYAVRDAERELTTKLGAVYQLPVIPYASGVPDWVKDTLAQIALYRAGVAVWDAVPGNAIATETRPVVVTSWQQRAADMLTPILERQMLLTGLVVRGQAMQSPLVDVDRPILYPEVRGPNATASDTGASSIEE